MKRLLKLLASSLMGFAIAGLVAYFAGRYLHEPEPVAASTPPPTGEVVDVVIAEPIPFGSSSVDAATEGAAVDAAVQAALTGGSPSSDGSEVVDLSAGGIGEMPTFAGGDFTELIFGEDGVPLAIPQLPLPGSSSFVDLCIGSEGIGCPLGVPGTVFPLRYLPPLVGAIKARPPRPGRNLSEWAPECTYPESPTATSIGVTSNMPAAVTVAVWPYGALVTEDDVLTISTETSAADSAAWDSWVAEPGSDFTDDRYWIDHCFAPELDPGRYFAKATVVALGGSGSYETDSIVFEVGPSGRYKRPTAMLGFGLDLLHVAATRAEDQDLHIRAYPVARQRRCPTDAASVLSDDPVATRPDSQVPSVIGAAVLEDPDYPYLLDHNIDVHARLTLSEGATHTLCAYWVNRDTSVIEIAEQVTIATPNGYRPTVRLLGYANLDEDVTRISLTTRTQEGCSANVMSDVFDLPLIETPLGRDASTVSTFHQVERNLCDDLSPLALADQYGLSVDVQVVYRDGTSRDRRSVVPLTLSCAANPCEPRPAELASVALPEFDRASAGQAVIEITYEEGTRFARGSDSGWYLGWPIDPGSDIESAASVEVDPRVSPSLDPSFAQAVGNWFEVTTPVRSTPASVVWMVVTEDDGAIPCIVGDIGGAVGLGDLNREPLSEFELTVDHLCSGTTYLATFTGIEWARLGLPVEYVDFDGIPLPGNGVEFTTGAFPVNMKMVLTLDVGGRRRVVQTSVALVTAVGPDLSTNSPLRWTPTPEDLANNAESDWQYTTDSACKTSGTTAGHLQLTGLGPVYGSTGEMRIRMNIDVLGINDGRFGTGTVSRCVPGGFVTRYPIDLVTDLESLREGVTFRSADDALTLTVSVPTE